MTMQWSWCCDCNASFTIKKLVPVKPTMSVCYIYLHKRQRSAYDACWKKNARLVTERDAAAQKNNALQVELTKLDSIRTNLSQKNTVLMGETGKAHVSSPTLAESMSVSDLGGGGGANFQGVVSAIDESLNLQKSPSRYENTGSYVSSIPRISQAPYQPSKSFSPSSTGIPKVAFLLVRDLVQQVQSHNLLLPNWQRQEPWLTAHHW